MKYSIAVCLLALASWCSAQQNIILIIADDLGADYCGFDHTAKDTAKMPNVRSLWSRGVRFTNAWATPYCSSTRACMLTGRYGFRTGVGTVVAGSNSAQIDTAEITIPRLLKKYAPANYACANVGKWHLNQSTPQTMKYPNLMGYDHFEGGFIGALNSYVNWTKVKNGVSSNVSNYATTETVDNALNWLGTVDKNRPFFLWLAFNAPHTPFHKPPDNLHSVPGLTGTQAHINQNQKLYLKAMTEAMDTEIGRLFLWLKQNQRWENTSIIFIGDNGNPKNVSQISDPKQGKGTLSEYGIRVPLLISGPTVTQPGRSSDALVNSTDLFATILELAGANNWKSGISTNKPVDAASLLPLLKNEKTAVQDWIFSELFTPVPVADDGKAIRDLQYKLIDYDNGIQTFFHLAVDPLEQQNLLTAPLSQEAREHYITLCNALAQLLGKTYCDPTIDALEPSIFNGLKILPNPTSDHITIVWHEAPPEEYTVSITDLRGRLLKSTRAAGISTLIDVKDCQSGVYIIGIECGNAKKHWRISKQ